MTINSLHARSPTIGKRYLETLKRAERVKSYEDGLNETEVEFIGGLIDRLQTYQEETYISAKQLNWLTNIEEQCDDNL